MSWGSLDNFLAMGGYGLYVWGSYGVTLALIAAELALLARRRRAALLSRGHRRADIEGSLKPRQKQEAR